MMVVSLEEGGEEGYTRLRLLIFSEVGRK